MSKFHPYKRDNGRKGPEKQRNSHRSTELPPELKDLTDLDYEAAIAQQQSIYAAPAEGNPKPSGSNIGPTVPGADITATSSTAIGEDVTVKRSGGGKKWEDKTLLEWDPSHFRLFVGNLGGDVHDGVLSKAFQNYKSFTKAKVVMDKTTGKNKGYGFVAFSDPEDYFRAFKEMNNKYIGARPVQLRKANTEINITKKTNKPAHYKQKKRR